MRANPRFNAKILACLVLPVLSTILAYEALGQARNCTIFTAVQGDTVLFGNSEDYHYGDLVLGIFPATARGFGSVHFGYRLPDGTVSFQGAVNDQGLAWDTNSTPSVKMNPHPDRPYYLGADNYLTKITREAATVDEAIQLAMTYHFGDVMKGQIHIGDAYGDAVVISGGADGEVAFTRKAPGDGYHLSTNFNLATNKGPVDFRWETSSSMLNALDSGEALTPAYAGQILKAVHLETLTTFTLYSSALDLRNNRVHLFYMSQFDEMVEIDMAEEFSGGERVVDMRDYFSAETIETGDAAYRRFERKFRAYQIGVVAVGALMLGGAIALAARFVRKR